MRPLIAFGHSNMAGLWIKIPCRANLGGETFDKSLAWFNVLLFHDTMHRRRSRWCGLAGVVSPDGVHRLDKVRLFGRLGFYALRNQPNAHVEEIVIDAIVHGCGATKDQGRQNFAQWGRVRKTQKSPFCWPR